MGFENLYDQIQTYCEANHIMGVLRITVGGKEVYRQSMGFADIHRKTAFSDASMFHLYSLTKPFCAIGLLRLKDKGLVELDAHPGKYVPEARGFDERVTIRHLLHHTSGLPDFEQNEAFAKKYAPGYAKFIRQHLKALVNYPSYFSPGTGGKYANINYVLCALIIENVSGMSYEAYMKQEVFAPLGLKCAAIDHGTQASLHCVQGYEYRNDAFVPVDRSLDWMFGAGDMVATVDDVYCLNEAIKNRRLLKKDTWEEVLTPSPLNKMGMGCTITCWHGKKRITHNGGSDGFRTLHIQLPEEDFDIIFLSNSGFGNARKDLAEMIYTTFYGTGTAEGDAVEMDSGYI